MSGMKNDCNTALELAELKGDIKAIRGETGAMEARIDASLARLERRIAERDKANIQWHIALAVAMTTLIIGAIAILP